MAEKNSQVEEVETPVIEEETTKTPDQNSMDAISSAAADTASKITEKVLTGVSEAQNQKQQIPGITPVQEEIPGITPVTDTQPQDALSRLERGEAAVTPEETEAMAASAQQKVDAGGQRPKTGTEKTERKEVGSGFLAGTTAGEISEDSRIDTLDNIITSPHTSPEEKMKASEELTEIEAAKTLREQELLKTKNEEYQNKLNQVNQYNQRLEALKASNPEKYGNVPFMKEPNAKEFGIMTPKQPTKEEINSLEQQAGLQAEAEVQTALAEEKSQQQVQRRMQENAVVEQQAVQEHGKKYMEDPTPEQKNRRNKTLSALSIAFGAFGSALTGGPNVGLEILNKQIDEELTNKQLDEAARLREQNKILEEQKLSIQSLNARTNAQKAKNDMAKLSHEIQVKQQENLKRLQTINLINEGLPEGAIQLGKDKVSLEGQIPSKMFRAITLENPELGKRLAEQQLPGSVPGAVVIASRAPKEAERNALNDNTKFGDAMTSFIKMYNEYGLASRVPTTEERAIMASMKNSLVGLARVPITGPGILTEVEVERILEAIGDPNKVWSIPDNMLAKMSTTLHGIRKSNRSLYNSMGATLPPGINEKKMDEAKKAVGFKNIDPQVKAALGTKGLATYKGELNDIQAMMQLIKTGEYNFDSFY